MKKGGKEDRKKSLKLLKESLNELIALTADLTYSQVYFRPAEGRWTIMDNIDHLIKVEDITWGIIVKSLEKPDEGQASSITDDDFIRQMSTREQNFNAPKMLLPETSGYASVKEALEVLKEKRNRTIKFVKTTDADLRKHFSPNPVFGLLDTYQWTLHPATHCLRHIEQIEEILAHDDFPAKK